MEPSCLKTLLVQREPEVATIVLNRPGKLNALSAELLTELRALLADLDSDSAGCPRALVITGAGERAFASGADVEQMAGMSSREALAFSELGTRTFELMERCSFPIIAAVRGFALGGGFELALAADFVIAAENAVFGLPEAKLGLMPGFGGTQRLARRVGVARARQMVFTGDSIKALDAKALGIANEVVPKEEVVERALAIARRIAKNGPLAISSAKRAINSGVHPTLGSACDLESHAFAALFDSEDARHGVHQFLAKLGPPEFKGH
jgi:enoyl-CoA hydratase